MEGVFQGVLPQRRTFEFRIENSNEVISGKVGGSIENAGEINRILERPVRAILLSTRVGDGRPRYRLLKYENLDSGSAEA